MKYIFFTFENEKFYIELDFENIPLRQIIIDENAKVSVSCREHCLAEGKINTEEIGEEIKIIRQEDFDFIWDISTELYKKQWEQTKRKYTIGKKIVGYISVFYPQGVIIKGDDFYAVCNNKEINFIEQKIKAEVKGYDEQNMWLIVE